jgi:hypothetical protein
MLTSKDPADRLRQESGAETLPPHCFNVVNTRLKFLQAAHTAGGLKPTTHLAVVTIMEGPVVFDAAAMLLSTLDRSPG